MYVFDNSPGDSGVISGGWSLDLTTIDLLSAAQASLSVAAHANGSFTLNLTGQPSQVYIIEASPDFINWTPVYTNSSVSGTFPFTDPNVSIFPSRFFRARVGP